jgi:hypothetical protein
MSNDSYLDWRNEIIRVCTRIEHICCKMQEAFVSNKESIENTDQNSKDKKLIEEKSILTQELKLRGHEMPCEFNLAKNDFSMENNDQLAKDE